MPLTVNDMYVCASEGCKCECLAEVLAACDGDCTLSCCGTEMTKVEPKTADATTEKHVPVIEKIDGGFKVTVGSVPHPMTEEHYIQFIEIRAGDELQRKRLHPGMEPSAVFKTDAESVDAIELCNVHGVWSS